MIEKHIVNIGYPRCGTSWLWAHANFSRSLQKEYALHDTLNFAQYLSDFGMYQVSANFQTNLYYVDTEIIDFVSQHATHTTVILRDPYSFVERYVDWISTSIQDVPRLTNFVIYSGMSNYYDIIQRWLPRSRKFGIFYFEDLAQDPRKFFLDYMEFCELDLQVAKSSYTDYNQRINRNPKSSKLLIDFTDDQILYLNTQIDKFQALAHKNLSHWKK